MEVVVNTAKRKRPKNEDEEDAKKPVVPKSALDLQKRQLEKLMKDPDKPIDLPKPRKEWKPRDPPEFVRHVMGSSAGAGSGEFHVYRGTRDREMKRNEWLEAQSAKEKADREYHEKLESNKNAAEQKTAKLRAKRQKKKQRKQEKKQESVKQQDKNDEVAKKTTDNSENEDDEAAVDEEHFVIGGRKSSQKMPEPTPLEEFENDEQFKEAPTSGGDASGDGEDGEEQDDVQEIGDQQDHEEENGEENGNENGGHNDGDNDDGDGEGQNEEAVEPIRPSSVNSQGNGSQRGGSRASRPKSNTSNASNELEKMIEEEMQNGEQGELRSLSGSRAVSRSSMESPAGWREKLKVTLLNPLEKEHSCPNCKDVLRYPVKLGCGHRLCYSCHQEIARVEPRCPVDQSPFEKEKPTVDQAFNGEILALQVICNNHEWGCTWQGTYKDVQVHLDKCDYADILCANDCGAKFQRRFLQKHLDKDCPKRIIPCAYCDERHLREEKRKHLEECKKVPLPCPNKCDKKLTIPREELDAHIEQECPRTKIMCQYEDIGCSHRSSREKLPKHYKTGIIEHVRLIYDLVMEQGRRLESHDVQLQDHLNLLQNHQERLADVERISRNQLIWRIEDYTRKLKEAKAGSCTTLFSPSFTTSKHGYRLTASTCLNGDGKGKGTHMSVFVSVLRGAYDALLKWPFDFRVTFYLLDQTEDPAARKHLKFSIKPNPCPDNEAFLGRPRLEKNASFGGAKFAKQEDVETRGYIKNDTIFIKITVDCDGSSEP